ncbi:MAG: helix-turn-helix domain-containing protein [Minisyncoccia bacterium]
MLQTTALQVLQTGAHVFLTGEPGSGKTFVVNQYIAWLRAHGIEPAITASTGIAATHVGGMTIHAWSGIGIRKFLTEYDIEAILTREKVFRRIAETHVLVIDEISMLSDATLTMVDTVCRAVKQREIPFGGIQIVLVGDFFQLPPIVRRSYESIEDGVDMEYDDEPKIPFAFRSKSWTELNPIVCYLHEQHRQSDTELFTLLRNLRKSASTDAALEILQTRMVSGDAVPTDVPHLYTHNDSVDSVNNARLAKITEQSESFLMTDRGSDALVLSLKKGCLSPEVLTLKVGARVMFTKNDLDGAYVNGTTGEVTGFNAHGYPEVKTVGGTTITAVPVEWTLSDGGKVLARITQIPLRLAWAITIHKSQGMTLSGAVIDLSRTFEYGQGYVALSRVTSLSQLYIIGINEQALLLHADMYAQDTQFKLLSAEARVLFEGMNNDEHTKLVDAFVRACGGKPEGGVQIKKKKGVKKSAVTTKDETLARIQKGMSLAEISAERGLTVGTICSHVFDLYMQQKIERDTVLALLPERVQDALPQIIKVIKDTDDSKLQPVFDHFKGAYTYDELRLVSMLS